MKDNKKLRKLLKDYGVEDENAIQSFIDDYEEEQPQEETKAKEEKNEEDEKMKEIFGI